MSFIVSTSDVTPDEHHGRKIWRLLNPDTVAETADLGAVAALVEYGHREEPADAELGGAHGRAEFYYVLSGSGVIGEEGGRRSKITAGDAFVIPSGVRHSIWAQSAMEPVKTFCVALKD